MALMRIRLLWPLLPGTLALVACVTGMAAGPAGRTRAYFAVRRAWAAHWPTEQGKRLPIGLEGTLRPFVPIWVQVEPRIRMLLDPDDLVSRTILETGSWEPDSWHAMQEHLHRGDVFVDVGAHIGYYSLKAAAVVGNVGRVIAVEPNPNTVRTLENNIRASAATDVVSVEPVACADSEGTLELFAAAESNTGESSLSRSNASRAGPLMASYRVRSRPLDDILRDAGVAHVDAVKVDVEGAEYLVLKGAQNTLARYHPVLIVELVDSQLRALGASSAQVVDLLRSLGYAPSHGYGLNVEFLPGPALTRTSQAGPPRSER